MIVMISGGFDPLHIGHLNMIEAAAELGRVYVALNSDDWLLRKKGYRVMPWGERARILKALRLVTDVIPVNDDDGTVCQALYHLHPHVFANGGDRTTAEPREAAVCKSLGIRQVFNVGGGKIRSSSELVKVAS